MFDWDDSEIASILWDEAAENGDHIVPYPKGSDDCQNTKEHKEESAVVKHNDQESPVSRFDLNEKRTESSSTLINQDGNSASGLEMDPWPELPLSKASIVEQEAISKKLSASLTEITGYDSERGADQLDKETELYQNNPQAKEQGDFVDYAWENIGSFDDFDRIFSNNEGVFGHSNLGNAEELWPSSKNSNNSSVKSFPSSSEFPDLGPGSLGTTSQNLEIKTEYVQNDDLSCSLSYGETNNSTSPVLHGGHGINRIEEQASKDKARNRATATALTAAQNTSSASVISDKAEKQKKVSRSRKRAEENIHEKPSQESYGSWSSSVVTRHLPSPVQQMQFPRPELYPYQQAPNQFLVRPMYGNLTNPYPAMPVMPHIQPEKFKHQQYLPSYNISPANRDPVPKSAQAIMKPKAMTPQEKIEKLRRRQQLRAMLAIEKQQQKLSQQVHPTTPSTLQSCPLKNQAGTDLEIDDLSTFNSLESNSPREQDDSTSVSAIFDDYSMEEAILHRLQDIINKLDMTVRLCIRDSLFRLARSAMQRQNATNTSSNDKIKKGEQESLAKEEMNSYYRLQDSETDTNPIDRTVAHLLFHRPFELAGKHTEPSESPRSTKPQSEHKVSIDMKVPETEPEKCKDNSCVDASENTMNIKLTDGDAVETAVIESSVNNINH